MYIYIYPYIYIYTYVSEIGGSEFDFRQAPCNQEIVLCHVCVRALWLSCGNAAEMRAAPFSLFPFVPRGFPFSLEISGEFHRVLVSSGEL